MGMLKAFVRFIGYVSAMHDTYVWLPLLWGGLGGVVSMIWFIVDGLAPSVVAFLTFLTVTLFLNLWFLVAWAPSKTSWGRKAKRRVRLNDYLGQSADTFARARRSPAGAPFQKIIDTDYEPWALEVQNFLQTDYDPVTADSWLRIGGAFTIGRFGRQSRSENSKLTEMNILHKKLENILRKEDGVEPRSIPELSGTAALGSSNGFGNINNWPDGST